MCNKKAWLITLGLFIISILLLIFSSCDEAASECPEFVFESFNGTDDYWPIDGRKIVNNGYPYFNDLEPL